MKPLADAIGASVFFGLVVVMLGCVPLPTSSNDLQPFIAVAGNYGVEEAAATPTPAPVSDVCESCRGTGKADGRATCPACNGTGKATKANVTSTGTTLLIHPAPTICKTGTCSTPRIVR